MFGDEVQTRLLECLLENPSKVFTQAGLARELECSPSSVSRVVAPLVKERLVMIEIIGGSMKAIALKLNEPCVQALLKFHSELKGL